MKDRGHDEFMAEIFLLEPSYAIELLTDVRRDGTSDELAVLMRQLSIRFALMDMTPADIGSVK